MTHKIDFITADVKEAADKYIIASQEYARITKEFNELKTTLNKINTEVNATASALNAIVRPFYLEQKGAFLIQGKTGAVVCGADIGVALVQII